jgi:hypothetical protein
VTGRGRHRIDAPERLDPWLGFQFWETRFNKFCSGRAQHDGGLVWRRSEFYGEGFVCSEAGGCNTSLMGMPGTHAYRKYLALIRA